MMKVLFTTNVLSFYRVNFFNELGKYCDLTVAYESDLEKGRDRDKTFYNYNHSNFKIEKEKFSFFYLNKLLRNRYDIIIIGTYATKVSALLMMILKFKRIKFFISADGGFIDKNDTFLTKFLKRFFISKASYYLSSGKETNKYLEYYGAKKENIFLYPFTSLYNNDFLNRPLYLTEKIKLRKKYGIISDKVYISVGRFSYEKGYDIFLNSLKYKNFKDIRFILISGGEEKNNYIDFIKKNNLDNVILIDYCNKETLKDYYQMSDVFFFPTRGDVWGLVVNEAMANGLPVISSDRAIASLELLDNNFLYNVESFEELSNKFDMINNFSSEKLYDIGLKNINIIKKYSIENMVKCHINIFKKVLKK